MVNEPSVFEPLKFYCISFGEEGFITGGLNDVDLDKKNMCRLYIYTEPQKITKHFYVFFEIYIFFHSVYIL